MGIEKDTFIFGGPASRFKRDSFPASAGPSVPSAARG
jgi:hypothetical protein